MKLSDNQLNVFVSKVLYLGPGKRKEYIAQVDRLIGGLERKIEEDGTFHVTGFKKTGSLMKGTVLKPKGDYGVDADIAVFLDVSEADKEDIERLHKVIFELLVAAYPKKAREDFAVQPRTLGIHFIDSGLDVDLVPVIPIPSQPGFGWQPSSQGGRPVKTSIEGQLTFIEKRRKADDRFRTIVRLAKKWRNELALDALGSFAIELILCHLNDSQGPAVSLEDGLRRFFRYIAQSGLKKPIVFAQNGNLADLPKDPVVILDPVNRDNNVTARLTVADREEIVKSAKIAWETIEAASWKNGKGDTLDLWKEIMGRSFTIDPD